MQSVRIYLSGPISGLPNLNRGNFTALRDELVELGYNANFIVVPHELFEGIDISNYEWEDYMRTCIKELLNCELVLTLPDWDRSKGAALEVHIARQMNIAVSNAQVYLSKIKKLLKDAATKENDTPSIEQIIASTNA